jgi:hypothetical protein
MNSGIPGSGPGESLEQLFGSVFDLAGQFAAQIGQDEIEARLRRTLVEAQRALAALRAAPPPAVQPVSAHASRAPGGDREAWDQIIGHYAPLVYAICRRHRLTDHDAQDVAQQIWRLLAERIATVREPAALPGWVATATTRECLRVLRMAQRAGPPDSPADEATIAAEIRVAEQNEAVRAAFADLPPRDYPDAAPMTPRVEPVRPSPDGAYAAWLSSNWGVGSAQPLFRARLARWCTVAGLAAAVAIVILSAINAVSAQQAIALILPAAITALVGLNLMIVPDALTAWRRGFRQGCEATLKAQSDGSGSDVTTKS